MTDMLTKWEMPLGVLGIGFALTFLTKIDVNTRIAAFPKSMLSHAWEHAIGLGWSIAICNR